MPASPIIRGIEACQLLSVFNIDDLKKKVARMEKEKADRKKPDGPNRFQNKLARGATGPQSFPAAKFVRGSSSSYASSSFQSPASRSFNYVALVGYVSLAAAATVQPYYACGGMIGRQGGVLYGGPGATFGGSHNYTAGVAQQPYHR